MGLDIGTLLMGHHHHHHQSISQVRSVVPSPSTHNFQPVDPDQMYLMQLTADLLARIGFDVIPSLLFLIHHRRPLALFFIPTDLYL